MQTLRFELAAGKVWVSIADASRYVELTRQSVHTTLINKGVVRAKKDASGRLHILRDDLLYVYQQRKLKKKPGHQVTSYQHLTKRSEFPEECAFMDGIELTCWAELNNPSLVRSKLEIPTQIIDIDEDTGQVKQHILTLESLSSKVERLERSLHAVLAVNGVDTTLSRMSPSECEALVRMAKNALPTNLKSREIIKISKVLSSLSAEHITQIRHWPQSHPEDAKGLLEPDELPYQCLHQMGRHLELQAGLLPGAQINGSSSNRVLLLAKKARAIIEKLCTNQAGVDILLSKGANGYLPVPLAGIDRFVICQLLPEGFGLDKWT
jgi:hypothetical protein